MSDSDLSTIIEIERKKLNDIAASSPKTNETLRQFELVRRQLVSHERELCLAQNLPVALPLSNWHLKWTQCHNKVQLASTESSVTLMCETYDSSPLVFIPTSVSFTRCIASRFALIDYDLIEEHSMFHSGLEGLGAYRVENSTWEIDIPRRAGVTHHNHYLFCFSTCIVDAIADDLAVNLGEARRGTAPGNAAPIR